MSAAKKVIFEIKDGPAGLMNMDIIFPATGEIRRKRRTREWLMRRVFLNELRTWKKNKEEVEYEQERGL